MNSDTRSFRWGVLSTAPIAASAYVPAIQASGNGHLYSVSSRSPDRAEVFAGMHGFVRFHETHEELLADPEVDGIYNPMPTSHHYSWTLKCLEAGKPVLCEKPFCETAVEAEEIRRISQETGVLAVEALMYRHHPLTQTLRDLILKGTIGELRMIENSFHAVQNPDSTRFDPALGGGALNDLGVYCVSHACFLAGEFPLDIRAAGWRGPTGVDESVSMSLRFPSGGVASLNCGIRLPFACDLRVTGTRGRFEVHDGAMIPRSNDEYCIELTLDGETSQITVPKANHYQLTAEAFVRAVRGEEEPRPPLESTIATLMVMDEVRSQISGKQ